jgi:TatD DNase family protein
MLPAIVDTHCHLTHQRFSEDLEAVIARAKEAGVTRLITIGTSIADAGRCLAIADRHPGYIACAAGLDPFACHEAGEAFPSELAELDTLLAGGRFCALGEIGLEYHHQLAPHEVQIRHFEAQLDLAVRHDLPIIIHSRDAHPDVLTVLRRNPQNRGVVHSFTGTADDARAFLELGWHLSFNGMVTFKANDALRAAVAVVPNDRLLVETDAPYLAPMPHRGKRCEPGLVAHSLQLIAEVRGQRVEDVAAWTTRNAGRLFRLTA